MYRQGREAGVGTDALYFLCLVSGVCAVLKVEVDLPGKRWHKCPQCGKRFDTQAKGYDGCGVCCRQCCKGAVCAGPFVEIWPKEA